MAVLSDHEIWSLIGSGRLKIDPRPEDDYVQTSAVDLTLAATFTRFRGPLPGVRTVIDTRDTGQVMGALAELGASETVTAGSAFDLKPGDFALAWTRETVTLPNFLCARVEGRSTLARLGLSIHQTAPTVHATFTGVLQLELRNAGPYELQLYPGTKICQLIIETLSSPSVSSYGGIHQGQ
ncbi:MAG: dCTP deaminase [Dehalococcoidia bacterium]